MRPTQLDCLPNFRDNVARENAVRPRRFIDCLLVPPVHFRIPVGWHTSASELVYSSGFLCSVKLFTPKRYHKRRHLPGVDLTQDDDDEVFNKLAHREPIQICSMGARFR